MGDTIWVLPEGVEEDDWDHSLVLQEDKSLDRLCEALGVRRLSELLDFSVCAEELGAGVEPNYVDPSEASRTISALIEAARSGHPAAKLKRESEVLEELEDMHEKLEKAGAQGLRVRLSVIQ